MSWKVLITARTFERVGKPALAYLEEKGCQITIPSQWGPLHGESFRKVLQGHDATLCSPDGYDAALFTTPEAADLKIISRWGVGYDSIDVPAATAAGIAVGYTPGLLDEAVADYAFALLLTLARQTHRVHQTMVEGGWQVAWGCDMSGKTLGIVGCGRIGRAVARRARGFGMRILAYDTYQHPDATALGVTFVPFDELLAQSDFVTLHAALTEETQNIMNEAQFKAMKNNALLINTARGGHVEETALVKALEQGWIAGAALDAYNIEPLPQDHPFRTAPNLLLSPHQASSSVETGENISMAAAETIVALMEGRRPARLVNPEVLDTPHLRASLKG